MKAEATAGIVLAAGAGRRFGGPKALASFGDRTLLEHAVEVLIKGGCQAPVHVVLGKQLDGALPAIPQMRASWNLAWRDGISASLRHGLGLVEPERGTASAVVILVDQPGIGPAAVERLIEARRRGAVVAVATYGGRRAHPVLLDRSTWAGVCALASGEDGGRAFMRAHPELVTEIACDDTGIPDDIDTPDDLARLERDLEDRRTCR